MRSRPGAGRDESVDPKPTDTVVADRDVIDYAPRRTNAPAFKLPGLRWWMIALIMFGGVLNYLTRNTLSVAQVRLQDTLHITEQQYSWITAAFQGAIMLQPICGYVLDVVGLRIGVAIFVVAWSVINRPLRRIHPAFKCVVFTTSTLPSHVPVENPCHV